MYKTTLSETLFKYEKLFLAGFTVIVVALLPHLLGRDRRPDEVFASRAMRERVAQALRRDVTSVFLSGQPSAVHANEIAFTGHGNLLIQSSSHGNTPIDTATRFTYSSIVTLDCAWWDYSCYKVIDFVVDGANVVTPKI